MEEENKTKITKRSLWWQMVGLHLLFTVIGMWAYFTSDAFRDLTGNKVSLSLVFVSIATGYVIAKIAGWLAEWTLALMCAISGISSKELREVVEEEKQPS